MILVIGAEKGGTGKTTLSTNLAAVLASKGKDILLVDTDTQGSASKWAAMRDSIESDQGEFARVASVQKFGSEIRKDILDLSQRYEHILVDAGGRDSVELRSALSVCDRIYIPLQAAQFDIWTLSVMDKLIADASIFNQNLEARVVINRASTNPKVSETAEALELEEELSNLSFSSVVVRERGSFRKAAKRGLSVCEFTSKDADPKAEQEITDLYQEIFGNGE
ncbi:AAA family ATPase [Waterburya agarophytonicola K14]|uniref:AAA family ATPase n=1 Tax=Waterburya agarophytonicola KI4 TaxID=2874699 RepID=A0A964BTN4_9CYAN|nr:AAA family ATPase [Waterburya agarophytonicola]MCC0179463.1 AAA family ATPase [Waterburya agarophytonicola KI4]